MGAWVHDVEVESTPLTTTGGHTWKAAYRLADFLSEMAPQLGLAKEGIRILELGSGTGWLGVTLARNTPQASLVCLTEQQGGLAWLQHNVELNKVRSLLLAHVQVQACDWKEYAWGPAEPSSSLEAAAAAAAAAAVVAAAGSGQDPCTQGSSLCGPQPGCREPTEPAEQSGAMEPGPGSRAAPAGAAAGVVAAQAGAGAGAVAGAENPANAESGDEPPLNLRSVRWDFIVGSDLIYNEVGSRCLPRVLAALAGPETVCIYSHTKHRFDLLDWEFFGELAACGMLCEEVWEPSAPEPPDSPEPEGAVPTDLFPDQRIAIYRITKQA